jgi:hypothetical protein
MEGSAILLGTYPSYLSEARRPVVAYSVGSPAWGQAGKMKGVGNSI